PRDEPLEEKAVAMLPALAKSLGHIERVVSSPAAAAIETTKALAADVTMDPAIRDWDSGRWAGRKHANLHAEEPENLAVWLSGPKAAPHGGESLVDLRRRVARWLNGIKAQRRTVAVTHVAFIRAAILHALDAPDHSFWRIDIEPLGIAELSFDGKRWALH